MQNDEQQIRELLATWMKATKAGDAQTVLDLMADDAVFLVAGHPPFGKDVFAAAQNEQSASSMEFDGESNVMEIKVLGDWAFMRTKLTVRTRQPGGKDMVRSGHTLTILTKKDGKWLLARDANLLVPVQDAGKDS